MTTSNDRRPRAVADNAVKIRGDLARSYSDVFTPAVISALNALAPIDVSRRAAMSNSAETPDT